MYRALSLLGSFVAAVLFGTIADKTTGQPLPGVRVRAGSAAARTDAHGRFVLRGLRPGIYSLRVSSSDVPVQRFSVRVAGAHATVHISACSTTLDYTCDPGTPYGGG